MHIRDKELNQIKKYAQGLGITVYIHEELHPDYEAFWDTHGKIIRVYGARTKPKTEIILCLIHELGHHHDWVQRGRVHNQNLLDALHAEKPNRRQRRLILTDEKNGAKYQELIFHELGLKIPLYKLYIERDFQIELYQYKLDNGEFPTRDIARELKRKVRAMHAPVK